jgi:spore coat protein U-like protein
MLSRNMKFAGAVALAFAATAAVAGVDSSKSIAVSSSVSNSCVVAAGATLAFAAYDPVSANSVAGTGDLAGTGSFSLRCTKGAAVTVGLDNGAHFSTSRRLSDGQATPSFLSYSLFQPNGGVSGTCPGTTAWDNSTNTLGFTSTSAASRTVAVCGTITGGQDVPAGSFTDTVTIYANF